MYGLFFLNTIIYNIKFALLKHTFESLQKVLSHIPAYSLKIRELKKVRSLQPPFHLVTPEGNAENVYRINTHKVYSGSIDVCTFRVCHLTEARQHAI